MSSRSISRRQFLASASLAAVAMPSVWALPNSAPSKKKGCCTATRNGNEWLKKIEALEAKWFYSWNSNKPDGVPGDVEFAPMVWGGWEENVERKCQAIAQLIAQHQVRCVMGFNEPDQHDQSNLSVEHAIEWWPHLMELGVPLVSPGCVHPDREWMRSFMSEAEKRKYRVDYVAVHSYGGPSVGALMKRMETVHKMYGRPIWITELAVGDWSAKTPQENKHSAVRIERFMRELLPALEEASFIERYAWFSAAPSSPALGTSALFDASGNLTTLGEIYRQHATT